jgi:hypothetical protein
MANKCLDILRDGLRAYDRTRRHPVFRLAAFVDEVQEDNLEWDAACAIRDRLNALRTIEQEAYRTRAAYGAAQHRLARLLEARGIAAGEEAMTAPVLPSHPIGLDARWQARADQEADQICQAFQQAVRNGGHYFHPGAMGKYRALIERLDALPARYAPELCDYITNAVFDRLVREGTL